MNWYTKYLTIYQKPFNRVPHDIILEIKQKFQTLQSNEPLVSVVVIAHNEEQHLLSCLWSLSESQCKYPIEIIGVNNNSQDKTEDIYKAVGIPYFNELQKSCGYARRCGLQHAKGKYYICIDSDTMYPPHYIEILTNELEKKDVVAVSSLWSYIPDKEHPWWGVKLYELCRDIYLYMQSFKRPELSVRGLVFAYRTELGRKVGYRVELIRGEDGSMAFGLKKYGKIHFIRNRKARAVTGYGTLSADGSFFNSFKVRIIKYANLKRYFIKKEDYKDDNSNLIK